MIENQVYLRLPLPEDLDLMWEIESDVKNRSFASENAFNLTKEELFQFILSDHDFIKYGQLRYTAVINHVPIGFFDLYDLSLEKHSAGIGIILAEQYRGKGFASQSLMLLEQYAKLEHGLKKLYAVVAKSNESAKNFFQKNAYKMKIPASDVQIFHHTYYLEKLL